MPDLRDSDEFVKNWDFKKLSECYNVQVSSTTVDLN